MMHACMYIGSMYLYACMFMHVYVYICMHACLCMTSTYILLYVRIHMYIHT
jgi:hypothetical protein